jgi:6-phosphogluconolactonase
MAPEFTVLEDAQAVARHAAAWLAKSLNAREPGPSAVCLSGGTTPRILYETLAKAPCRDAMPWKRIHWFWCDERFVPSEDERSNYRMVQNLLLERVSIPRENVHAIPTGRGTPAAVAAAYEDELKRFYGAAALAATRPLFEVTFLGVGDDGHTASLFPGSPVLQERALWAAAVPDARPEARITLTYPVLESSREVAFLVTGAAKREIMEKIFEGETDAPAARLRPTGRVHWFVDRAAAPANRGASAQSYRKSGPTN